MNKNTLILLGVAMIVISGFLLVSRQGLPGGSILAVSKVYIDPQNGSEDPGTHEWVNSYWMVLSTSQTYGDHVFYELNNSEVEKYGADKLAGKDLEVKASVQVNVKTEQPYVQRMLRDVPYRVCLPVYGTKQGGTVSQSLVSQYYDYDYSQQKWVLKENGPVPQQDVVVKETTGDWQIIIPMTVTASKIDASGVATALTCNGNPVVRVEATGEEALLPLSFVNPNDPEETFDFKLEGMLGTGFTVTLGDMVVMRDMVFQRSDTLLRCLSYDSNTPEAYVRYWYGQRATDKYDTSGSWVQQPDGLSIYTKSSGPPGIQYDTSWLDYWARPRKMWIYDDPPSIGGKNYQGLLSYIKARVVQLSSTDLNRWGVGYEILSDRVRINIPYNSYLWMYTLKISTELADTYVWQPHYISAKFSWAKWTSTGTDTARISDRDGIHFQVTNNGTVDGVAVMRATVSPSIIPLAVTTNSYFLKAGYSWQSELVAVNLGVTKETTGDITISIYDQGNKLWDSRTLHFTLLPINGTTVLNVMVQEAGTGLKLSGVPVTIQYGLNESEYKLSNGGWSSFDLKAYQGPVSLTVEETVTHKGTTGSLTVKTGPNEITLTVEKKTAAPTGFDPTWLIVGALIAGVGITSGVLISRKKGMKKEGSA